MKDAETETTEGDKAVVLELQEHSKALETATGDEFVTQLPGLKDDDAAQTATVYAPKMKQLGDKLGKLAQTLDAQSSKETTKAKISSIEAYGSIVIDFEAAKKSLLGLDAVSLEPSANQNRMDTHRRFPPNMARNTFLTQSIVQKAKSRSYNHTGAKSFKDRIAEKKARTNCKVCGKKGHWAGDAECTDRSQAQGGAMTAGSNHTRANPADSKSGNIPALDGQNIPYSFFE